MNSICFKYRGSLLLFIVFLLAGCSSTFRTYQDTLSYAFFPGNGADLSIIEVQSLARPGLYVTVDDRPRALLTLLHRQNTDEKWLSHDRALIQLQHGRLIHTAGFSEDLHFRKASGKDYLQLGLHKLRVGMQFEAIEDYKAPGYQSLQVKHHILKLESDTFQIWQQSIAVQIVYEQVEFFDGSQFVNEFWFAQDSGQLLRSKQKISPFWSVLDIIHISDVAQLERVKKS